MRSPEAARAIPELVRAGLLAPERAAPLLAAARGEIVSVRAHLRALLGLGVALVTTGIGIWLKQHHDQLGPSAIAALLTLATFTCLIVVARRAPAFTWRRAEASDWIVDGLLLLAIGLLGADLGWIETQFTPLGANWPLHLLAMSLVTGALALRFDSTVVWTLALSTFAAWRGVADTPTTRGFEPSPLDGDAELRLNLLLCALLFAALGRLAERFERKAHFEPATTFLGALAAAIAFSSGLDESGPWPAWAIALAALGGSVAVWAFRRRRLGLLALGVLALYVGATRFLFELPGASGFGCFWFAGSTVAAIALLVVVQRRFQTEVRR